MTADIRILESGQIKTLIDWAAAEGWNPGLDDARAFELADPNGFLGAFVDQRMVAGISVVAYDDYFGFLGLYICHPEYRQRGYGRAVWDAGMAYLGNRTIGLDGVSEQQDNYRRMGFVTQYETVRMGGALQRGVARHCQVVPLDSAMSVHGIDRTCFPAERRRFLEAWIAPPRQAMVALRDGKVAGYAVVRTCRAGQKIGPLFAMDTNVAMDLLAAIKGDVQIDVPAHQIVMIRNLEQIGFRPQFGTARMYRGVTPNIRLDWIYAVTTLELG